MVDSPGLENRYSSKQRTIEGSNPSLSFFFLVNIFVALFYFIAFQYDKGKWARLSGIAEPEKKIEKKIRIIKLININELKRKEK